VEILAHVVQQLQDNQDAIKFLEKTEAKVQSNNEAVALCKVLKGQILLDKLNNQEQAKKIIEEVEAMLDTADGVTTVHGRFYLLASRLYRLQGKHAEYYRTALRYFYKLRRLHKISINFSRIMLFIFFCSYKTNYRIREYCYLESKLRK